MKLAQKVLGACSRVTEGIRSSTSLELLVILGSRSPLSCPPSLHAGAGCPSDSFSTPQGAGDHCYYHGKLRGNPQSFAALSTCQGLQ